MNMQIKKLLLAYIYLSKPLYINLNQFQKLSFYYNLTKYSQKECLTILKKMNSQTKNYNRIIQNFRNIICSKKMNGIQLTHLLREYLSIYLNYGDH